jgi:uracil-DNA glycosylase family 4
MAICPVCKKRKLIPAYGPEDSPLLLIGPYPGQVEKDTGVPWTGPAGQVLLNELARVGIVMENCRRTNIWQHDAMWDNEDEFRFHFHEALDELGRCKVALIMGSDTVRAILNRGIMEISGLIVPGANLPPGVKAVASVNPAQALSGTVGELRHAIGVFGELTERYR